MRGVSPIIAAALLVLLMLSSACGGEEPPVPPTPPASPVATPTPAGTPAPEPTEIRQPTVTVEPTQSPTAAPAATPTATVPPQETPTHTPMPTPTPTPTPMPTPMPTPTPAPTPTPEATATPEPTATPRPTLNSVADPEIDFADLRRDAFLRDNLAERSDLIHGLPWVEDGLVLSERRAVQGLIYLAIYGGNTFFDLLGEEWVLAGENKPAIETLGTLARRDQKAFQRIVEHPTIKDGISDDEADVVATLWGVHRYAPDLVDKLLDPDRVQVERGTITLPLAGDVDIAIIRTRRGNEHTLELLGNAARFIEEFMAAPFPQPDFNYLFEHATSPSSSSSGFVRGINSWTNITTKPEVDSAEYSWTQAYRHFVHETAHFYWRDGQRWINEGAATFLEAVAEHETTGSPLALERGPCSYARTIGELETLDPERTDRASVCYYILGERVFHDLYRSLSVARPGLAASESAFLGPNLKFVSPAPHNCGSVRRRFRVPGPDQDPVARRPGRRNRVGVAPQ